MHVDTDQFRLAVLHDSVDCALAYVRNLRVEGEKPISCLLYSDVFLMGEYVHDHLFMLIRQLFLPAS